MAKIDAKMKQIIDMKRFSCLTCLKPDCLKSEPAIVELHLKNLSNQVFISILRLLRIIFL